MNSGIQQGIENGVGSASPDSYGIGLDEFAMLCARRWILLVSLTILAAVAAVITVQFVPRWYEAKTLLLPVTSQSGGGGLGGIGSAMSQLSGVASLVGLSIGTSGGGSQEAVATLQSEILTEQYVRDHDLLPVLYKNLWDAERRNWKTTDPDKAPTLWKANQYFFKTIRNVEVDPKTGLITLTISWTNPKQASDWANGLVALTNEYLRGKAIAESERDISYLDDAAAKTSIVELRSAVYALMENEIKKEMMAKGNPEYGLKVIDPAATPERAAYPRKPLWVLAGAALGLILGVVIAVIGHSRSAHGLKP